MSRISSTSQSRRRVPTTQQYQPLLFPDDSTPATTTTTTATRRRTTSSHLSTSTRRGGWEESGASESGMSASGFSVLSAFPTPQPRSQPPVANPNRTKHQRQRRHEPDPTDSPLRSWTKSTLSTLPSRTSAVLVAIGIVLLVKSSVGLGSYSGYATPPLRGDFEAQRHWISLTSSTLASYSSIPIPLTRFKVPLYHPVNPSSSSSSSTRPVPIKEWYSHDLGYWGLDYPPLTAYHSYLLGFIARLSPETCRYVTMRPPSSSSSTSLEISNSSATASSTSPEHGKGEEGSVLLEQWEQGMRELEDEQRGGGGGGMKNFMRSTVLGGDLLLWFTAVGWYCWYNFGKESKFATGSGSSREKKPGQGRGMDEKALRTTLVAALTILLQPALILIDNGHFQYNSLMLALSLWSINAFQAGHDLIGSVLFVASLGFKQMALYYAPGVFAYLLGKCLWLGGREGLNLFLHLGLTVSISFTLLFLPFLQQPFPGTLFQSLERIFPFARGLFEDKVANFWCALNVVIKLRNLASVATLARLSLVMTVIAVLPSTVGVVWISHRLGLPQQQQGPQPATSSSSPATSTNSDSLSSSSSSSSMKDPNRPAPTSHLLPHLVLTSSLSFFLFSFQVHEKSILLPLMPLTLLMGGRERGYGRLDWEWGVLLNNVAVFSMYPLLKRDGLTIPYIVLTLIWNYLIGYNPIKLRSGSFVKLLSLTAYSTILVLHVLELVATPPRHLPDLYPVLNLTLSAGVFGLGWLWAGKRLAQESWAIGGF